MKIYRSNPHEDKLPKTKEGFAFVLGGPLNGQVAQFEIGFWTQEDHMELRQKFRDIYEKQLRSDGYTLEFRTFKGPREENITMAFYLWYEAGFEESLIRNLYSLSKYINNSAS